MKLHLIAIAKDEAPYIREWIEYHRGIGVTDIHILDNASVDGTGDIAYEMGCHVEWHSGRHQQMPYYRRLLYSSLPPGWYGFLDIDEFIQGPVLDVLAECEGAALGLTWRLFGPSGHYVKTDEPVQKRFTRSRTDSHIKSIVKFPVDGIVANDPHYLVHKTVDCNGVIIPGPHHMILEPAVCINHYFTKSVEEFVAKCSRGRADGGEAHNPWHWLRFMQESGL
jgi:hypothetical protein